MGRRGSELCDAGHCSATAVQVTAGCWRRWHGTRRSLLHQKAKMMLFGKQLYEILISHGSGTHSSAGGMILWPLMMVHAVQLCFLLWVQGSPGAADRTGVPRGPKKQSLLRKSEFLSLPFPRSSPPPCCSTPSTPW